MLRHGISFPLHVSALIAFICFMVFIVGSFTFWLSSSLGIIFGGRSSYCNEAVFLISFLGVSLLAHKCATHFCILILYVSTLVNLLFPVGFFFVKCLVCLYGCDHFTCKQRQFDFLFFQCACLLLHSPV